MDVSKLPYRPFFRRPFFNAGPFNAGPNYAVFEDFPIHYAKNAHVRRPLFNATSKITPN